MMHFEVKLSGLDFLQAPPHVLDQMLAKVQVQVLAQIATSGPPFSEVTELLTRWVPGSQPGAETLILYLTARGEVPDLMPGSPVRETFLRAVGQMFRTAVELRWSVVGRALGAREFGPETP
jgi:hypothetical protein